MWLGDYIRHRGGVFLLDGMQVGSYTPVGRLYKSP